MGLVTVFRPLTTIGVEITLVQTAGETKSVADCKVNPVALLGQDRTTSVPADAMVNCGGVDGNEMLNIVPLPQ